MHNWNRTAEDSPDPLTIFHFPSHAFHFPSHADGPRFAAVAQGSSLHWGHSAEEAVSNFQNHLWLGVLLEADQAEVLGEHDPGPFTPLGKILRESPAYREDPTGALLWLLGSVPSPQQLPETIRPFAGEWPEWCHGLDPDLLLADAAPEFSKDLARVFRGLGADAASLGVLRSQLLKLDAKHAESAAR